MNKFIVFLKSGMISQDYYDEYQYLDNCIEFTNEYKRFIFPYDSIIHIELTKEDDSNDN